MEPAVASQSGRSRDTAIVITGQLQAGVCGQARTAGQAGTWDSCWANGWYSRPGGKHLGEQPTQGCLRAGRPPFDSGSAASLPTCARGRPAPCPAPATPSCRSWCCCLGRSGAASGRGLQGRRASMGQRQQAAAGGGQRRARLACVPRQCACTAHACALARVHIARRQQRRAAAPVMLGLMATPTAGTSKPGVSRWNMRM